MLARGCSWVSVMQKGPSDLMQVFSVRARLLVCGCDLPAECIWLRLLVQMVELPDLQTGHRWSDVLNQNFSDILPMQMSFWPTLTSCRLHLASQVW